MGLLKFFMKEEPGIIESLSFLVTHGGDKGAYGEWLTKYMFGSVRFKGYFKVLSNIYLPYKDSTTEIDIVLLHEKGIYVLESKNYSGWIFGSENQIRWTQSFSREQKEYFYNPIKQNRTHIAALSQYLGIDQRSMRSYIVFSERCELKKIPPDTNEYAIMYRNELISILNKELNNKPVIYSNEVIDQLEAKLKLFTNVSDTIKHDHIDNINQKFRK